MNLTRIAGAGLIALSVAGCFAHRAGYNASAPVSVVAESHAQQPGDPTSPGGPTIPPTLPTLTQNPNGDGTRIGCLPGMYSCGWSQR